MTQTLETQTALFLRRGNRQYPAGLEELLPEQPHVHSLPSRDDPQVVRQSLVQELRARLPLADRAVADMSTKELIQTYTESLNRILEFRSDMVTFLEDLCRCSLEVRQPGRRDRQAKQDATRQSLDELVQKATFRLDAPNNVLHASHAELPPELLQIELKNALDEALDHFGSQLFEGLDVLVDQGIAGLVEWTGKNSCLYHFFRYIVIQEGGTRREEMGVLRPNDVDEVAGTAPWIQQIHDITTWDMTHRLERHEHHTLEAFQTSLSNAGVVIPPNVQTLIAAIPQWLCPVIRVINGTLFREVVVSADVRREKWEQVQTRDVPVYGCEPAIIIGPIVLTGWGPREIEQELRRQKQRTDKTRRKQVARSAGRTRWRWLTLGLVTQVISLTMVLRSSVGPFAMLVIWAALCGGMICWARSLQSQAAGRRLQLGVGQPYLFALGVALVSGGAHLLAASIRFHLDLPGLLATVASWIAGVALLYVPHLRPQKDHSSRSHS